MTSTDSVEARSHTSTDTVEAGVTDRSRGQSEVVGVVLVLAIMFLGAIAVVGFGAVAIGDTQEQLSTDRAEKALTQMDAKAGLVALDEADSQRVNFATDTSESFRVNEGTGWMNVTIENRTTGDVTTIMNVSLGSVNYEKGDTRLAYQGGGVWRATDRGGEMVSPPEFHFRNGTLTLPTVNVTGSVDLGDEASITQNGEEQIFPNASKNDHEWLNPLDNHKVNVTVQSEFYQGWGNYFEARTDGKVLYDDSQETATLELLVPSDNPPVEGGLVSGATQTLVVKNNAQLDSYNSSSGNYAATSARNTKIVTAGDISIENNAIVYGNIEVDGSVNFENNGELWEGNISYGETVGGPGWDANWNHDPTVHWTKDNASVVAPDPVDLLIEERIDDVDDENDNGDVADISSEQLSCSTCNISSGAYHLDRFELNNDDSLELDTSGGNIEIAVDGNVFLGNDAKINVTGPNRVNIWVDGQTTLTQNSIIKEAEDNATRFWMYMRSDETATLENNAELVGVIYGPGKLNPGVEITLRQNAQVYGGAIGEVDFASNNVWIHYDEALSSTESVTYDLSVVKITYLHVTVNRIRID